jgi:hypothetical protein
VTLYLPPSNGDQEATARIGVGRRRTSQQGPRCLRRRPQRPGLLATRVDGLAVPEASLPVRVVRRIQPAERRVRHRQGARRFRRLHTYLDRILVANSRSELVRAPRQHDGDGPERRWRNCRSFEEGAHRPRRTPARCDSAARYLHRARHQHRPDRLPPKRQPHAVVAIAG